MRILISLSYYSPNISGLTIYVKTLAEELVKNGHEVTILTSQHKKELNQEETLNGVRIVRIPVFFNLGKGPIMPSFPFYALRWAKWADVVNCHLPQFESLFLVLIAKFLGKKNILTHHTDLSKWNGLVNVISERAVFFSQFLACMLANKITVYTEDYAKNSLFLKRFMHKLVYVYPPIEMHPTDQTFRTRLKREIGEAKYLIGFSGRIARQKGLPYLFEALPLLKKKIKNFKIVFAGPYKDVVGEKYIESIDRYISKYKSLLIFLGPISYKKISAFYKLLDLLVLPSDDRLESFGLVQVEAMLSGCPVVATDLPGVRVPIRKTGMGIIVKSQNAEALASAIVKILLNKKAFFVPNEKVKKIFDLKKTIKTYEKIFK